MSYLAGIDRLFMIGAWETVCRLLDLGPLDVLGPKCHESSCAVPASVVVWLPQVMMPRAVPGKPGVRTLALGSLDGGTPPRYCERHAMRALEIFRVGFGLAGIKTERLEYSPASDDPAVKRARLLELDRP